MLRYPTTGFAGGLLAAYTKCGGLRGFLSFFTLTPRSVCALSGTIVGKGPGASTTARAHGFSSEGKVDITSLISLLAQLLYTEAERAGWAGDPRNPFNIPRRGDSVPVAPRGPLRPPDRWVREEFEVETGRVVHQETIEGEPPRDAERVERVIPH